MAVTSRGSDNLARQIVRHEMQGRNGLDEVVAAGEQTWERLRQRLVGLIGTIGFDALASRAVRLAAADVPWLSDVRVDAVTDGGLGGLRDAVEGRESAEVVEGLMSLLATFLTVLTRLIRFDLVLRLVSEEWIELRLDAEELYAEGTK